MKCYNKKTFEIGVLRRELRSVKDIWHIPITLDFTFIVACRDKEYSYASMKDVYKEWKELKDYYTIDRADKGGLFIRKVSGMTMDPEWVEEDEKSGIKFDTMHEAESFIYDLKKRAKNNLQLKEEE